VKPATRFPNPFRQNAFDKGMDILIITIQGKDARLDVTQDGLETIDDPVRVGLLDDPALPQHSRVGDASHNVMPVQPTIEEKRTRQFLCGRVRIILESTAPELHDIPLLPEYCAKGDYLILSRAATFSGSPKTSQKPFPDAWSKASALSYVAIS